MGLWRLQRPWEARKGEQSNIISCHFTGATWCIMVMLPRNKCLYLWEHFRETEFCQNQLWSSFCGLSSVVWIWDPGEKSGDSSSSKCILYSKMTFFHFDLRDDWARQWDCSILDYFRLPCDVSTFSHPFFLFPLNFFLCFLIPFPLNVSPCLTSLLTLTGVGKKLEDTQPTSLSGVLSHCCRFSLEVALGHKTWETNINGYLNHRCSLL